MKEQFDDFQKFIKEEFNREGEEIEQAVRDNPEVSGIRADDSLKEKLDRKIEAYEEERRRELISMLSEEDREALALGREMKVRAAKKRKKFWKRLGAAAAVVALVLTMGITGFGGPRRLVEVLEQKFGGRDINNITSTKDDNIVKLEESEEEQAYQQIKDAFNIEPVRIVPISNAMVFKQIDIDEYIQTANLIYDNNGKSISYIINCSYVDESFGLDVEDEFLYAYDFPLEQINVQIKAYAIHGSESERYVAQFEYKQIHYRLVATLKKQDFELILQKMHFS